MTKFIFIISFLLIAFLFMALMLHLAGFKKKGSACGSKQLPKNETPKKEKCGSCSTCTCK